jgi:hypothetical protein
MEWTTEQPTTEGIYWAARKSRTIPESDKWDIAVVEVVEPFRNEFTSLKEGLYYYSFGDEQASSIDYFTHWYPLELPEPPKE